jgi:acyl-CoA synthetase (AMP-forming)/AMP-acid ligase II
MATQYFWNRLESFGEAIALEEGDRRVSYGELVALSEKFAARLPSTPELVALQACNRIEAVAAYLGCLRGGHPVILLNPESIADGRVLSGYQPDWPSCSPPREQPARPSWSSCREPTFIPMPKPLWPIWN